MFKDNFQYPINSISWAICHCPQANVFGTVLQFDLLNWISISDTRSHVIIYLSLVNGLKWTFSPVDIHIFYSERLLCTSNRLKTDRVYFIWIRGNKSLKETVYSSLILYYNGKCVLVFELHWWVYVTITVQLTLLNLLYYWINMSEYHLYQFFKFKIINYWVSWVRWTSTIKIAEQLRYA